VTRAEFEQAVERHNRGLVRFAARLFPGGRVAPEDIIQDAAERVTAAGAYLKYQAEPDATRAPAWLRKAVELSGLALVKRGDRRARLGRQAAREQVTRDNLMVAKQGGNQETGVPPVFELGDARRDSWAYVDAEIEAEDLLARHAALNVALAELPADVSQALLDVYGRGMTWAKAAAEQGYVGNLDAFRRRGTRALLRLRQRLRP
jgi:DNA-directed RNA polymerase specialized sigma24 family protein